MHLIEIYKNINGDGAKQSRKRKIENVFHMIWYDMTFDFNNARKMNFKYLLLLVIVRTKKTNSSDNQITEMVKKEQMCDWHTHQSHCLHMRCFVMKCISEQQ